MLKNYVATEITRKADIMLALANIYEQVEAEKKAAKFGLDQEKKDPDAELTAEQREEKARIQAEQQTEFIADNKRMM